MDWRIFLSTFGLIFLAELGDKTQLTAFAISAGSRSSWSVFLGATLAFVVSGALAVVLGLVLKRLVPLAWVQLGAGVLFLVFGVFTLIAGIQAFRAGAGSATVAPAPAAAETLGMGDLGTFSRFALRAAVEFEERAVQDYRSMQRLASQPQVSDLFRWLSHADSLHHRIVSSLEPAFAPIANVVAEAEGAAPVAVERPLPDVDASRAAGDLILLEQAEKHEESAQLFYKELARTFAKYEVASHFAQLAEEEAFHLEKIRKLKRALSA